ncbi:MAG: hypothetical protein AAB732_01885 [Patescibacteria group bacterium]
MLKIELELNAKKSSCEDYFNLRQEEDKIDQLTEQCASHKKTYKEIFSQIENSQKRLGELKCELELRKNTERCSEIITALAHISTAQKSWDSLYRKIVEGPFPSLE